MCYITCLYNMELQLGICEWDSVNSIWYYRRKDLRIGTLKFLHNFYAYRNL